MPRVFVISAVLLIVLGLAASQPAQAQPTMHWYVETFAPTYAPPNNPVAGDRLREIYPGYPQLWDIVVWTKDPLQTYGKARLTKVGPGTSSGNVTFYDIIVMTVVDSTTNADTTKFEYIGPFGPVSGITEVGSRWHELYPTYSRNWTIIVWVDNGNGYLDYCDYLVIGLEPDLTTLRLVHVIGVVTGAKMQWPTQPALSSWGIGILVALLAISAVWFIMRRRRFATLSA